MHKLMLIIDNLREKSLLRIFLEQQMQFEIVDSYPNYANYLRASQYKPNVVIIELPKHHADQLNFVRLFKRNNNLKKTKVIAYGDHTDQAVINTMNGNGVHVFLQRPIKTDKLMQVLNKLVPGASKPPPAAPADSRDKHRAEDLQFIMNKEADREKKIELMVGYINNLMAFPFTVTKVLKITQDVGAGAGELAVTISLDPVISARILKLANSVLFSSRNQVISDIKQAIVRIGFRETKNVAMSMSVMKLFSGDERSRGFDRTEFWYHSLACAVIAELIAKKCGYAAPEEVFMAGLLHDFGLIILDEYFSEIVMPVIEKATRQGTPFILEEENLIGVTHADIAASLFAKWELPQPIRHAMRNHHLPFDKSESAKESLNTVNACVGLANLLAKVLAIGRDADQYIAPISDAALEKVKCLGFLNARFFEQIFSQVNLFCRFLNIEGRKFPEATDPRDDRKNLRVSFIDRNNFNFHPIEHYLRCQGFPVAKLANDAKSAAGDLPPNLIILHAKPDDGGPAITALYQGLGKNAGSGASFSVPTLVLHSPKSMLSTLDVSGKVRTQVDSVDLRNIDMAISQLLGVSDAGEKDESPTAKVQSPALPKENDGLSVTVRETPHAVRIIDLTGSIRMPTLAKMKDVFLAILQAEVKNIALNFADVAYIDSSGLGLIVNFYKRLTTAGGKLCLLQPNDTTMRLLEDMKLNKVLPICAEEKDLSGFFA
jgi:anti-anti-sigma factor